MHYFTYVHMALQTELRMLQDFQRVVSFMFSCADMCHLDPGEAMLVTHCSIHDGLQL